MRSTLVVLVVAALATLVVMCVAGRESDRPGGVRVRAAADPESRPCADVELAKVEDAMGPRQSVGSAWTPSIEIEPPSKLSAPDVVLDQRVRLVIRAELVGACEGIWGELEISIGGFFAHPSGSLLPLPADFVHPSMRWEEEGEFRAWHPVGRGLAESEIVVFVRETSFDEGIPFVSTLESEPKPTIYARRQVVPRHVGGDEYEIDLGRIEFTRPPVLGHLVVRSDDEATCEIGFVRRHLGGFFGPTPNHRTIAIETNRRLVIYGRPKDDDELWSVYGQESVPTYAPDGHLRARVVVAPTFGAGDDVTADLVHPMRLEVVPGGDLAHKKLYALLTPADEHEPIAFEEDSLSLAVAPMIYRQSSAQTSRGRRGFRFTGPGKLVFERVAPGAYVLDILDHSGERRTPYVTRELVLPLPDGGDTLWL